MFRELAEETGLAPPLVSAGKSWTIINTGSLLACLLDIESSAPVGELGIRARRFLSSEHNPELADVHCITSFADVRADVMPEYMHIFFARQFGTS